MKRLLFFLFIFFIPFNVFAFDNSVKKVGAIIYNQAFFPAFSGLKDGLKNLGYIENDNILYIVKNIKGDISQVPLILEEFSKDKVDLIFTTTTLVILEVKKYISKYKIPVIFNEVAAPLKSKVVNSLSKPGGYLTGISHIAYELIPKRVEIFKDAFPFLKSIIFFYNPDKKYIKNQLNPIKSIAKKLKISLIPLYSRNRKEMLEQIKNLKFSKNSGLFMFPDAVAMANSDIFIKLSHKYKLPLMVLDNIMLSKGGCIGYSPSFYAVGKQSAYIAFQIFGGVKPGNIPVQYPEKVELLINLKEIKKLGLEFYFNKNYLIYADKVLK